MNRASTSFQVGLQLPTGWFGFSTETGDLPTAMATIIEERIAVQPELAEHQKTITATLADFAQEVKARNAIVGGLLIDLWDNAPVIAHLVTYVLAADPDVDEPLERLASDLGLNRDGDLGPRYVDHVDLAPGRSVRVAFIGETDQGPDRTRIALSSVQYWSPIPGTSEVLVLSFSTPTLARAEMLEEAFDSIAATLAVDLMEEAPAGGS